jgi:hypothetical protein
VTFQIPDDAQSATCKACKAVICWVKSKNDRPMPLVETGRDLLGRVGTSHFADCPAAPSFRKLLKPKVTP